jgi:type IV pilus assembly protein PilB
MNADIKIDGKSKLGDILIEANLLTKEQLKTALEYQKKTGLQLGEILGKLGFVNEDTILRYMADQYNMGVINLQNIVIPRSLIKKIPFQLIEKYNIIPIGIKGDTLTIATSDPTDDEAIDQVQLLTNLKVDIVLATASGIKNVIRYVFQPADGKNKEKKDILQELSGDSTTKRKTENIEEILNNPITKLLIEKNIITEEEIIRKIEERQ